MLSRGGDAVWKKGEKEMEVLLPSLLFLVLSRPAETAVAPAALRTPHHCTLIRSYKVSADVSDGEKSVCKEGVREPTAVGTAEVLLRFVKVFLLASVPLSLPVTLLFSFFFL